jgi:hypothetical protein
MVTNRRSKSLQHVRRGTRWVHLSCTLELTPVGKFSFLRLTGRPRFVGLTRPTPRRHSILIELAACAPRLCGCGARLAARGRPATPTPSHSRRAGARLLALGFRQSGGESTPEQCKSRVLSTTRSLCSPATTVQYNLHAGLSAWRQSLVVHRPHPTTGRPASRGFALLRQGANPHEWQTRAAQAARVFTGG